MTITFAQMGFGSEVTPISATPAVDGYFGTLGGLLYGIHPTATPEAYVALVLAIAADTVTVNPYVPIVIPAPTLVEVQASQTALISAACASAITSGFTSTALGETYTYPSQPTDQANLSASIIAALLAANQSVPWVADTQFTAGQVTSVGAQPYTCVASGPSGAETPEWPTAPGQIVNDGSAQWELWTTPFWCESAAGVWAFVNHTAPQIMAVGQAGKQAILANMAINVSLATQIAEAETIGDVQAIVWPA